MASKIFLNTSWFGQQKKMTEEGWELEPECFRASNMHKRAIIAKGNKICRIEAIE